MANSLVNIPSRSPGDSFARAFATRAPSHVITRATGDGGSGPHVHPDGDGPTGPHTHDDLSARVDGHDGRLNEHDGRLSRLEQGHASDGTHGGG